MLTVAVSHVFVPPPARPCIVKPVVWAQQVQTMELFSALVAMSLSQHRVRILEQTGRSNEVLHHYALSLRNLSAKIATSNGRVDLSDILAAVFLLGTEITNGSIEAYLAHLRGLRQLVAIYRDVQRMILTDECTRIVNYFEYIGSFLRESAANSVRRNHYASSSIIHDPETRLKTAGIRSTDVVCGSRAMSMLVPAPTSFQPSSHELNHRIAGLPAGFRSLALAGKFSPATIGLLDRFCSWKSDKKSLYNVKTLGRTASANSSVAIQFPLMPSDFELCFQLPSDSTGRHASTLDSCVRLATGVSVGATHYSRFPRAYHVQDWFERAIYHPRLRLASMMRELRPKESEIPCLLWMTVTAVCSAEPVALRYAILEAFLDIAGPNWPWIEVAHVTSGFIWYVNSVDSWQDCWEEGLDSCRSRHQHIPESRSNQRVVNLPAAQKNHGSPVSPESTGAKRAVLSEPTLGSSQY